MIQIFLKLGVLTAFASSVAVTPVASTTLADSLMKNESGEKVEQTEQIVKQQRYIVQSGDILPFIARKFNVQERQIKQANNLKSGESIFVGQELLIPELKWEDYEGTASWYGPGFHGRVMANGKIYDQNKISVAHRTAPLGTMLKITNLKNGKSIIAPVLDRGPYVYENGEYTREVDLSYAVAKELDAVNSGLIPIKIELIENA